MIPANLITFVMSVYIDESFFNLTLILNTDTNVIDLNSIKYVWFITMLVHTG